MGGPGLRRRHRRTLGRERRLARPRGRLEHDHRDGTGERRWRSYLVLRGTTDALSELFIQEFELRRHDTGWRAEPPGTARDWFFDAQFLGDLARVNGSWFRRVD